MSSSRQLSPQQQALLRVYALRWRPTAGSRGRNHMAIFVPNLAAIDADPVDGGRCLGTLYHVGGAPMVGFTLEIRRNWDSTQEVRMDTKIELGSICQQHMWEPTTTAIMVDDNSRRSVVDGCALMIRPPRPTQRVWVAEEVMDCQDWIVSFLEQLIKKEVIACESLAILQTFIEPKVALMAGPSSRSTQSQYETPDSRAAVTDSAVQLSWRATPLQTQKPQIPLLYRTQTPVQPQQVSEPAVFATPAIAMYGSSQWVVERGRYERYNRGASRWEYRGQDGCWHART